MRRRLRQSMNTVHGMPWYSGTYIRYLYPCICLHYCYLSMDQPMDQRLTIGSNLTRCGVVRNLATRVTHQYQPHTCMPFHDQLRMLRLYKQFANVQLCVEECQHLGLASISSTRRSLCAHCSHSMMSCTHIARNQYCYNRSRIKGYRAQLELV